MANLIGMFLGAIVAVYLVSLLFRWALRRLFRPDGKMSERSLTLLAVALAAGASFVVSGYGFGDVGSPDYSSAWIYIVAAVPVLLIMLARSGGAAEAEAQG